MFHAIKMMFIFIHHFLFIDQNTGQVSNTKFFANVGYIIWCALFPYAVMHGSQAPMDLWLVFGAVVIGNRTLNVMLQNKAGIPADPANTWKGVVSANAQPAPDSTTVTTSSKTTDPTSVSVSSSTTTVTATVPAKIKPNVPDVSDLVQ